MKKLKGIFICLSILFGAINFSIAQSKTTVHQNDPAVVKIDVPAQQQADSVTQQPTTNTEPENANAVQQSSAAYRVTEKIRVYSGNQTGNNLIKTIDVVLPESSTNTEAYIPH
ncbi:MAG: hypothetical protein ABI855_14005 [Bacteroidota bacterium]